ncbi:MAG: FCD domain-containing protein [Anaerovoracaceae bacterium]
MKTNDDMINVIRSVSNHNMPVGASLLCNELHYSQATIGRLMAACEEEGLLEKVSNKGRIITEKGKQELAAHNKKLKKMERAHELINHVNNASKEELIEIIEVRKILEAKATELACLNATDNEINELKGILMEYLQAIYNGELGNEQDLKIHLKIAEMSRNKTLYGILSIILTTDNSYTTFAYVTRAMEVDITEWHTDIVDAIAGRNPDLARANMIKHLTLLGEGLNTPA